MPALGRYRESAPDVEIDIALTDRNVDLVEEGFDLVFRIGSMPDSSLIARPLAPYRMIVCASPGHLARMGTPEHPQDLNRHEAIAFTPSASTPWRFTKDEEAVEVAPKRMITVNNGQALHSAAKAGLGLIMQPEILVQRDLEADDLVRLLPTWYLGERPMWLVYYRDRLMTPRLRSFISFATTMFAASSGKGQPRPKS
ncbi:MULTISPECIES: LysR substrate-binding domain-containing protein [Pseudooceanicola]|uniref:LysR substrate-binding domain-containing protein n=1 Tax=Pseudooceanicola TaxID=1679449 RepID=UPI001EF0B4AF|nr:MULTISPECIES: LysR substrate-binding domain-containing protein [Pseudooceanicola]